MRDRDRICSSIARVPRAGQLAALATVSAVAALVALVGVGGASADPGIGGAANGSRPLALSARGLAVSSGAEFPGAPRFSVPSPGHQGELSAIDCVSASDCWAVGDYQNSSKASLNEALRWNGRKWSKVTTPNPGGTASEEDFSALFGVTCVSASNCWAVGESQHGSSAARLNQVLRFNGEKWSKVKTPNPGGTASEEDFSELFGVTCVSASECWAAGESERGNSAPERNEVLRFNGRKWSNVKTPNQAGTASPDDRSELSALACVSGSDCWAVGDSESSGAGDLNEALRWNGKRWSEVKTFDPAGKDSGKINRLLGVACASASDCWAVGEGVNPNNKVAFNEVLHWGGKKWSHVRIPQPSNRPSEFLNPLSSVECSSATNCWAVGYYLAQHKMALLNDAMHWNGRKWSHIRTPQPAGTNSGGPHKVDINALLGVSCAARSECRAVGTMGILKTGKSGFAERFSNEALHWNGKRWSKQ